MGVSLFVLERVMQDKLLLNRGDKLVQVGFSIKGFLNKTDIKTYSIINENGLKVGTVIYQDKTSIFGGRSQSIEQRDMQGYSVQDLTW